MAKIHNPASIAAPAGRYSHGVEVPPNARRLYISGQVGIAPDGSIPPDLSGQVEIAWRNIKAILAEAGMSFADVVRFNAFVTDRAYFSVYGAVRSRYVAGDAFASTLVVVAGFTRPEFKIEVEVTAAQAPA